MRDKAARRVFAMLLVYPLVTVAVALDVAWALFYRGWWPPTLYTVVVTAIAAALAASSQHVHSLPAAASFGALIVSFTVANTVMVLVTGEVVRSGRSSHGVAVIGVCFSLVALALTAAICILADQIADRLQRPHRSRQRVIAPPATAVAPTVPLPTLVDLTSPSTGELPTRVIPELETTELSPDHARTDQDLVGTAA
ncbi:hypothetical protein [Kribbella sp. NPDC006257]|uniref:hypothetical protein n=1 Tax=Kribbella sp. NPDC006257 TaxID=3156738 RepID=UPI0033AB727D